MNIIDDRTYCVYAHINKVNGKIYIGRTIHGDNPNKRWSNGNGYKTQQYFWKAIEKYGWDNFDHEIISSGLTKEEANNMEMLLIEELQTNSPQFGYNATLGGEGTSGYCISEQSKDKRKKSMQKYLDDPNYIKAIRDVARKRPVWQFSEDGQFINEYESTKDAERNTGVASSGISHCALRNISSAGGYIWTFVGDIDDLDERILKHQKTKLRKEPIIQLTLDGEYITEWQSAHQAGRELGINYKNINAVCHQNRNCAGGYRWMYVSDYYKLHGRPQDL